MQDHDYTAALKGYINLWRRLVDGRVPGKTNLFFARYANASGDRTGRAFLNETGTLFMDAAADQDYLKHLRRALAEGGSDLFSGTLTQAQIIMLHR